VPSYTFIWSLKRIQSFPCKSARSDRWSKYIDTCSDRAIKIETKEQIAKIRSRRDQHLVKTNVIFVSSTFLAKVITVAFVSGVCNICTNKRWVTRRAGIPAKWRIIMRIRSYNGGTEVRMKRNRSKERDLTGKGRARAKRFSRFSHEDNFDD